MAAVHLFSTFALFGIGQNWGDCINMATRLRHYVTDDLRCWDALLPVLTLA